MIFQHTWEQILAGTKTQTRRLAKGAAPPWRVGRSYAVQPGRGKHAVGRILVTAVRREPLGRLSAGDVQAEGYASRAEFEATWSEMHGAYDPEQLVDVVTFEVDSVF